MLTHGHTHYTPDTCFGCRIRTIALHPSTFQAHYNWSVGKWVNNRREYTDELKRASDAQSLATGIDADYQPVDLLDRPPAPDHD